MAASILGIDELQESLNKIIENISDKEIITKELDSLMNDYVHILTGYLKSTIYHTKNIAGAKAPYAGFEEERNGEHAYATKAIEAFDINKYINKVIKPF